VIKGIKFASVPVTDQDRALHFYTEKLGCAVVTDQPFDDRQRWIELRFPGAETGLVLFTPEGHEGRIGTATNITLWSTNVERTHQQLAERGVVFSQPPFRQDWGTAAIFKDPDGNVFVLSSK